MSNRPVMGDVAITSSARAAGTYTSGPIANAGDAQEVFVHVYCSAVSGAAPTLNTSLEESSDGATWTAIAGSSTAQLTAAGSATCNATPAKNYVRVTTTVAGTVTSMTYRAVATFLGS